MCYRNPLSNTAIKVLPPLRGGAFGSGSPPPPRKGFPAREGCDAEALAAPREVPKST